MLGAVALALGYSGPAAPVQQVASLLAVRDTNHQAGSRAHGTVLAERASNAAPAAVPNAATRTSDAAAPAKVADAPAAPARLQPHVLRVVALAYCLSGRTALGLRAAPGSVAVDPSVIPLGTRLYVQGYGDALADDIGGAVRGSTVNVWLPCRAARAWGVRVVSVTVLGR